MTRILAPFLNKAFWKGVFVYLLLIVYALGPINASASAMDGKVQLCTGYGIQWVDIDGAETTTHDVCNECTAIAPLAIEITVPMRSAVPHIYSHITEREKSLVGKTLNTVSNKDPPFELIL